MDTYQAVRTIPFPVLAPALGIDLATLKTRRKKGGLEWFGPCPIHGSKTPTSTSFSYHETGLFGCFSCKAKGKGSIDLTKALKGIGFQAAVELLTPLVGKEPPQTQNASRESVLEELQPFKGTYHKFFQPCSWLTEQRGIPQETLDLYGAGWYNNPARKSAYTGKVLLPVRRLEDGQCMGYLARAIDPKDDSPKYFFPKGFPKHLFLFGAHEVKSGTFGSAPLKYVYLVESPLCVMKYHSMGLPAVSPFGWSVSGEQCHLLQSLARGVIYLPDGNRAHESASALQLIARTHWVRCPQLPEDVEDPEHLTLDQIRSL